MTENENKLKLSLYLSAKGISPNSPPTMNASYKSIKLKLKNECRVNLNVKQIDLISIELMKCLLAQQISEINRNTIITVYMQCITELKPQIELIVSKEISENDCIMLIKVFVQFMTIFDNQRTSHTSNRLIHPIIKNESVRTALNTLFQRHLTESEFQLILEPWSSYIYLAQDAAQNNAFVEQIREIRNELRRLIKSKRDEISANETIIEQLTSFKNFLLIDLEALKVTRDQNKEQLSYYLKLEQSFQLNNGSVLNTNNLKENAYFSVLFCAELLGLSAPERNKDGNLLITFLDILLGLSEQNIDQGDIRNRLSHVFNKYMLFKTNSPDTQLIVKTLIKSVRDNPKCFATLKAANEIFQSKLLQLNLQPNPYLISKDT